MDELKQDDTLKLTATPVLELEEAPPVDLNLVLKEDGKEVLPAEQIAQQTTLSEEEMKTVREFSQKIDITNPNMIIEYGSGAQKHIAAFSETALDRVKTKDMGEVGSMLSDLVVELKGFSADEQKGGFLGLFRSANRAVQKLVAKYNKVEINVEKISEMLENHQVVLLKDIAVFEKMYEMNLDYFKELSMYIEAGKIKLKEIEDTVIPQLKAKAEESKLPEDAQKANDMAAYANNFDKRLHDLELTRMISIQMGPQIRLLQNNDSLMVQKINSSLVNTIPLWKSQMLLALGLAHSQQAMEAQREVTDMTNELLKKNAETLKQGSVEIAKEGERGIVDIETLTYTNKTLIETIDDVLKIQEDGRAKRRAAETELGRIEGELKQKLLEVRK
ncbi:MAG: toxic anion resistance protein [Anaerofustis sp.]